MVTHLCQHPASPAITSQLHFSTSVQNNSKSLTGFPLSAFDLWLQLQAFLHTVHMPADIFCKSAALPSQLLVHTPGMSSTEDPSLHILRYQMLPPWIPTSHFLGLGSLACIRVGQKVGRSLSAETLKMGEATLPTQYPPGMAQRTACRSWPYASEGSHL